MTIQNATLKEMLARIKADAEAAVNKRQDSVEQEAARLAECIGPLAAAYRVAEIAQDLFRLAERKGIVP